jgi:hypothetical protein
MITSLWDVAGYWVEAAARLATDVSRDFWFYLEIADDGANVSCHVIDPLGQFIILRVGLKILADREADDKLQRG